MVCKYLGTFGLSRSSSRCGLNCCLAIVPLYWTLCHYSCCSLCFIVCSATPAGWVLFYITMAFSICTHAHTLPHTDIFTHFRRRLGSGTTASALLASLLLTARGTSLFLRWLSHRSYCSAQQEPICRVEAVPRTLHLVSNSCIVCICLSPVWSLRVYDSFIRVTR